MTRPRLALALGLLPAAVLAATVGYVVAVRDRLPDPIATHFAPGGEVDGTGSLAVHAGVPFAIAVALWLGGLLLAWRVRPAARRAVATGTAAAVALASLIPVLLVIPNVDVQTAAEATLPRAFAAILLLAPAVGVLAWLLAGATAPVAATAPPPADAQRLPVAPGEHVVWTAHERMPFLGWIALGVVAFTAVVGVLVRDWTVVATGVASAGAVAAFSTFDVFADARGVRVAFGPFDWPRLTVPLAEVQHAEVIDTRPREWGGWGVRWTPRGGGSTGVIVRRGPALHLHRADGRRFVVTVRDADRAAATVNGLLARDRTPGAGVR